MAKVKTHKVNLVVNIAVEVMAAKDLKAFIKDVKSEVSQTIQDLTGMVQKVKVTYFKDEEETPA